MINWNDVETMISEGCTVTVRVRGVSMYPSIFTDDIVTLNPVAKTSQVPDRSIVLAKTSDGYVLHRLQNKLEFKGPTTQGDNLDTPDKAPQKVIAVVTQRRLTWRSLLKRCLYSTGSWYVFVKRLR